METTNCKLQLFILKKSVRMVHTKQEIPHLWTFSVPEGFAADMAEARSNHHQNWWMQYNAIVRLNTAGLTILEVRLKYALIKCKQLEHMQWLGLVGSSLSHNASYLKRSACVNGVRLTQLWGQYILIELYIPLEQEGWRMEVWCHKLEYVKSITQHTWQFLLWKYFQSAIKKVNTEV